MPGAHVQRVDFVAPGCPVRADLGRIGSSLGYSEGAWATRDDELRGLSLADALRREG
jgi:hypothetical protein